MDKLNTFLSIGGSDCSAGAGIQADLRTAARLNVYACTAVTCVTVQSSKGVDSIVAVDPDLLKSQIYAVINDVFPKAIKIGLLPNLGIVKVVDSCIGSIIESYRNYRPFIIFDTIISPTLGRENLANKNSEFLDAVIRIASNSDLITPNIPEFYTLCRHCGITDIGMNAEDMDMVSLSAALEKLSHVIGTHTSILLKGGHSNRCDCMDILYVKTPGFRKIFSFPHAKIESRNTHGTGCVLSSAIACGIVKSFSLPLAVSSAISFVKSALVLGKDLSYAGGYGPCMY